MQYPPAIAIICGLVAAVPIVLVSMPPDFTASPARACHAERPGI